MKAAELVGWKRAFCNKGPRWEQKSVATLMETGNPEDVVQGIVLKMTLKEVEAMDPWEGYPSWYNRVKINLKVYNPTGQSAQGELIEGQTYI